MTDHQRGIDMSNAMIEAACSATILGEDEQGRPVHLSPEEARTALTAAISAYLATTEPGKPESGVLAVAVKVKPLLWEDELDISRAQTNLVACYSVWDAGDHWECSLLDGKFKDVDAAKAAAEADYEQRVMSALSTPPQPEALQRRVEELEAALKPFSDFAGELFARNFNASDSVDTIMIPGGGFVSIYGRDFFAARVALIEEQKKDG